MDGITLISSPVAARGNVRGKAAAHTLLSLSLSVSNRFVTACVMDEVLSIVPHIGYFSILSIAATQEVHVDVASSSEDLFGNKKMKN